MLTPYIIRIGVKRRKRGDRKFREVQAQPDKSDNAASSVRGITRENARPGMGAIRIENSGIRKDEEQLRLDSWIQIR